MTTQLLWRKTFNRAWLTGQGFSPLSSWREAWQHTCRQAWCLRRILESSIWIFRQQEECATGSDSSFWNLKPTPVVIPPTRPPVLSPSHAPFEPIGTIFIQSTTETQMCINYIIPLLLTIIIRTSCVSCICIFYRRIERTALWKAYFILCNASL